MERPESSPNFHENFQKRRALRQALREAEELGLGDSFTPPLVAEKDRLNKSGVDFKAAVEARGGGFTQAKALLKEHKAEAHRRMGVDESKIREELGERYDSLSALSDRIGSLSDFELRRLREGASNPYARSMQQELLAQIKNEKATLQQNFIEHAIEDPNTVRAFDLVELREGLFEEGHIAHTPSVKGYLSEIGVRMIHGKPMFIHGPTGTGKTSLARYAAQHFTGKNAEMVYCTPQTRESHIWGKTGIKPSGESGAIETVEIFGPLARSMRDGSIVVFDEFTALPREQMVFLKGVANAKPGDKISVPGNGEIAIAPGFQMVFTANLKSDKNPERQELPPEIAREFEQNNIEVRYTPKDEAYDIMLARLMRADGTLELSQYDLNTTLPKLCEAMAEIQTAYADSTRSDTAQLVGALSVGGRAPSLKKFVVTQGTVEAIIESWETEKQLHDGITFAEYVDGRLATGLSFKEYPEGDRILAAKIFALKGFLRTLTPTDLDLPQDIFNFDAARKARTETVDKLRQESGKVETLTLRQLAELDPFDIQGKRMTAEAQEFLAGEDPEANIPGNIDAATLQAENDAFFRGTLEGWYGTDGQKATQEAVIADPGSLDYKTMAQDTNPAEFGKYILNPEAQGIDFENTQVLIPDLSGLNGRPIHEVMKHVADTYGSTHYIPGIEYWKWILENPAKASLNLKDGNYYYFTGSLLRGEGGDWDVPYADWSGSEFSRSARWLRGDWDSSRRVVLLEK